MKNKILKFAAVSALAILGALNFHRIKAATYPFVGYLINNPGLTYNTTATLNVNSFGISSLSAQAVYSSATYAASTFKDGTQSTGSFTVVTNTALTLTAATDTLKILSNTGLKPVAGTATIWISSFTAPALTNASINLNGQFYSQGRDWFIKDVASNTVNSIAAALDGDFEFAASSAFVAGVATITVTCSNAGVACNGYFLASSTPTAIAVSSTNFIGGADGVTFTLNSLLFQPGVNFNVMDVASNTVVSIVNGLNSRERNYITNTSTQPPVFTLPVSTSAPNVLNGRNVAVASNTWVVIQAVTAGSAANKYALSSSSPTALAADSALFQGGSDAASIGINGTFLRQGVDWSTGATAALTATNIKNAINANSVLSALVTAGVSGAVVTSTSVLTGANQNYGLFSSTPAITTSAMTNGVNSAYAIGSGVISLPSHGFSAALPVLYTSGTFNIGGLTNQTTYYVVVVDANDVGLSSTSAVAQTGVYITLTSSSTQLAASRHTFTLAPLANAGTPAFFWQASNDGVNWLSMPVSSVTINSYNGVQQAGWDFGVYDYQYLRLNITGPTAGALSIQTYINSKN